MTESVRNRLLAVLSLVFLALPLGRALAHPGVGIVRDRRGNVFYTDLMQVWRISPDGQKSVAVRDVHTHELAIDSAGNVYGEDNRYLGSGEGDDRYRHRIWRRSPDGRITNIVPWRMGFWREYGFVRDRTGAMYWIECPSRRCSIYRRSAASAGARARTTTIARPGQFTRPINWMAASPTQPGVLFVVDGPDLRRVDQSGRVTTVARNIGEHLTGLWATDSAVYVAVSGARAVFRIDLTGGRITPVVRSPSPWAPTGVLIAPDGHFWLLEYSTDNAARVRRVAPDGTSRVFGAIDQATPPPRPFGTLREQAETQQRWLVSRMSTVLPAIMRRYAVEMWVIPMREYNEDPVFTSIVSPTTFAARRRTIYVFAMRGDSVERIALGGSSQGGVYTAVRSTKPAAGPAGGRAERNAELWGDEQWQALKKVIEERNPRNIAVNVSRVFAFSDGLSAGEMEGMREALGEKWTSRFVRHDGLALDLIATRLPEEAAFYRRMQELVWAIIDTAFSNVVITPGVTRTDDVVWWMRQRVNDLGLGSWFQPSVSVQRRGATDTEVGTNPIIQRGDVLHCDFGIVALRLTTDTQHMGYVLREGETAPPAGLVAALRTGNRLQDILMEEVKPGRTGNEVLRSSLARMRAAGIEGTVYTHPIGMHGHGAGPLIGLWDYQDGVPGRGDAKIISSMWFSIELQATSPVPEWNGQRVRMALEEDMTIDASGTNAWALRRQTEFHLVR